MERESGQPEAPALKSGSKPDTVDDLKSLPLLEVEKKLGSSPDGLSQAEAQNRLSQYGPNEFETLRLLLFIGSRRIARSGKIEN